MRIIIAGAGEVGFHLAKLLAFEKQLSIFKEDQNFIYIAKSPQDNPEKLAIPLVSQDNMLGILWVFRNNNPFSYGPKNN